LSLIGFVEGEGAVQAEGFTDKLWIINFWIPIAAGLVSIPILRMYKLRDKYVKVMVGCNTGVISREDAEKELTGKIQGSLRLAKRAGTFGGYAADKRFGGK
jgi:hypothetical protein